MNEFSSKQKQFNFLKGRYFESLAVKFLEKKGYEILARNFRWKFGEIDILAWAPKKTDYEHQPLRTLVAVEVRSRSESDFRIYSSIGFRKLSRIQRTLEYFCYSKNLSSQVPRAFEVIFIQKRKGQEGISLDHWNRPL